MKLKSFINRVLIFFLILFSGFVFYLGWEQLELEENSCIAVFTKTSGWKEKVVDNDGFNWSFEKVIPTNYSSHKFTLNSTSIGYTVDDQLPSGELYAEFNGINNSNFNYTYQLTGNIKFDKSYLVTMLKTGTINSENFPLWQDQKIEDIQNSLKGFLRNKISSDETLTINGAASEYIKERYPYFIFSDIFVSISMPDMNLYNLCRNKYIQNMEAQTKADEKYLVESLKQKNQEMLRLDLLKQYGEVFTKYPIMIEYLKVDKNMVLDRATMEDFITQKNQN